ncbi:MAG: 3-hydroxyacyl-CoA dehydrogenase family protein [Planctomycetes bacterium]|jgi:3-hydroxybutyryl-CoA dehydrogenase|nr:3-hydroxyacyl-CoA dehydrogenase family protein [Planctomycetota bacterium]MCL4731911.1 3-hydroxyacyl-CoA dehydrogenase family protein [Planctomycetota bacterium]
MTITHIAVIGAGTMGHGIAHVAAGAGYKVALYDIQQEFVDRGLKNIAQNLDKGIEKGKTTPEQKAATLGNIAGTTDLARAASGAQLVIEAIPEKIELKQDLYAKLEGICGKDTVFGSNTSSLSIARLAAASKRPDRFLGMHFFNPVHIMKLLELVVTDQTSPETLAAAQAVGARLGKDCIVVKDFPGFATSRLGVCLGLEAIRMVEQGVASAQDIDKAMELGYAHPMGPLKLTDVVGLDVRLNIADYLHKELGSDVFKAPGLMRKMVAENRLGKKTGQGFYKW